MHRFQTAIVTLALVAGLAPSTPGQDGSTEWYAGRLALGTRVTWFSLMDDKHTLDEAFLGNLDQLDDNQDLAPYKLFAQYWFCDWGGVELGWDKVSADVVNEPTKGAVSDGTVEMSGPMLSLMARLPTSYIYTPYAGLGVALWSASFDHAAWHHYGYESPEAYASAPEPRNKPQGGKIRDIDVEDAIGLVLTAGCDVYLTKNWSVDLYARYLDIAADAEYQLTIGDTPHNHDEGSFPLEHVALGAGVKYTF